MGKEDEEANSAQVRISFSEKLMCDRRMRILYGAPSRLFPLQTQLAAQIGVHASLLFLPVLFALAIVIIPLKLLITSAKKCFRSSKRDAQPEYYDSSNTWMETKKRMAWVPPLSRHWNLFF